MWPATDHISDQPLAHLYVVSIAYIATDHLSDEPLLTYVASNWPLIWPAFPHLFDLSLLTYLIGHPTTDLASAIQSVQPLPTSLWSVCSLIFQPLLSFLISLFLPICPLFWTAPTLIPEKCLLTKLTSLCSSAWPLTSLFSLIWPAYVHFSEGLCPHFWEAYPHPSSWPLLTYLTNLLISTCPTFTHLSDQPLLTYSIWLAPLLPHLLASTLLFWPASSAHLSLDPTHQSASRCSAFCTASEPYHLTSVCSHFRRASAYLCNQPLLIYLPASAQLPV